MTHGPFHPGERTAQERAGVARMADRIGGSIHSGIPERAADFLDEATLVVLATTDPAGRPWASVLTGAPGFIRALDAERVVISAQPAPGDPLAANLADSTHVGLLVPDFTTRRRVRLNGRVERGPKGEIVIRPDQVYANCPKYIQRRAPGEPLGRPTSSPPVRSRSLTEAQRRGLRRTDTFFLATANPGEGADASHRGGTPGFLQVEGDAVRWPDYSGNMMFNTIGNIVAHPWAGWTVPDFGTGDLLLLTGSAAVEWQPTPTEREAGAERMLRLEVAEAIELRGALGLTARLLEPSPHNPARVP